VDLIRLAVNGQLVADQARFAEAVDLSGARMTDLFLDDADCTGPVNASGCVLGGDLVLAGARLREHLDLSYTQIGGSLSVFTAPAEQTHETETVLPKTLDVRGLKYTRTDLETDDRRARWLELADGGVTHEPQPYLIFEQVLRSGGREDVANAVHYEMRLAEGRHIARRLGAQVETGRLEVSTVTAWLWNRFLRISVGYGVYGYRLGFWIFGILLASTILAHFGHHHGFVGATTDWKGQRFLPHLYAIDTWLPVIGLGLRKYWEPKGWLAPQISAMLLALGWISVPLIVALISGALKKKDPR
jgi:hypothetical protein